MGIRPKTNRRIRSAVITFGLAVLMLAVGSAILLSQTSEGYACPPGKAELVITKSIVGDAPPGGHWNKSAFQVRVQGPGYDQVHSFGSNGKIVLYMDQAGDYTVTEILPGYPYTPNGPFTKYCPLDKITRFTITNTGSTTTTEPPPGSLKITKFIQAEPAPPDGHWDYTQFKVRVTGPNDYLWEGYFNGSGVIVLIDLVPGKYTVTETEYGPYSVSGEGDVTVKAGKEATKTITNKIVPPGSLKITKRRLDPEPFAGHWDYTQFKVQVTGPGGYLWEGYFDSSGVIVLTGLKPGKYTVSETEYGPYTVSGEGSVTVNSGREARKTITNRGPNGGLWIIKAIRGDAPPGDHWTYGDFVITVTGPDGFSWSGSFDSHGWIQLKGLTPGEYTILETTSGPYTVEGEGPVTVAKSSKTVRITNTYIPGSLLITKSIEDPEPRGGHWTEQQFAVNVSGPSYPSGTGPLYFDASGEISLTDLVPGAYTVTEVVKGLYEVSGEGGVTVVGGEQATLQITNTGIPPGELTVYKNLENEPEGIAKDQFSVRVTGPGSYDMTKRFSAGGVAVFENLVLGTYKVEEIRPAGDFSTTYNPTNGQITLDEEQMDGTITVTNTWPTGELTVHKELVNEAQGTSVDQFSVRVTGPHGYDKTKAFDATGKAVFDNLVLGDYTVVEILPSGTGCATTYSPDSGINLNVEVKEGDIYVTNTWGSLKIIKLLEGDNPNNAQYSDFEITVTGPDGDSTEVFKGNFNASGEIVIYGLVPGEYVITETDPAYPFGDVVYIPGQNVQVIADVEVMAMVEVLNTGITTTTTTERTTTTGVVTTDTTDSTTTTTERTTTTGVVTTDTTERTTTTGVVTTSTDVGDVTTTVLGVLGVQAGGGGLAGAGPWGWVLVALGSLVMVGTVMRYLRFAGR